MQENERKGWRCAIGGGITVAVFMSALFLNTLFIGPISETYGCSVTTVSVIYSMQAAGSMIMSLFVGFLLSKFNPKFICTIASIAPLLYYGGMAVTSNIYVLWGLALVLGIGNILCGQTTYQILISSWFSKGSGTIVTTLSLITNILKFFVGPLVAVYIEKIGMRETALLIGIIVTLMCFVDSILFICRFPDAYGMKPISFGKKTENQKKQYTELELPVFRIARMPVLYLGMLSVMLLVLVTMMHSSNASLIYQGMGLTPVQASYAISLDGMAAGILAVVFGLLCDNFGVRRSVIAYSTIGAVVMFITPNLSGWLGAIILALFVGVGEICNFYGMMVMRTMFGRKRGSSLIGWAGIFGCTGGIIGPPICAALAAVKGGSYSTSLMVEGFLYIVILLFSTIALSDKAKAKILKADEEYRASLDRPSFIDQGLHLN